MKLSLLKRGCNHKYLSTSQVRPIILLLSFNNNLFIAVRQQNK